MRVLSKFEVGFFFSLGSVPEGLIRFFICSVLPPISTTGLTVADIPALATRVRDQMLETLREISVVPTGSGQGEKSEEKLSSPPSEDTSRVNPSPTISDPVSDANASSASLASSFSASTLSKSEVSENGAETEEDEGMILVGRPA